jgi:hypothetical protein
MYSFSAAISAAAGPVTDAKYTALATAISAFNAAKQQGTKTGGETPAAPNAGALSIVIAAGEYEGDPSVSGGLRLYKSEASGITLRVENVADYTAFIWLVEGVEIASPIRGSLTLRAVNYETGCYCLTAVAFKGGVPYARTLDFVVVE